MHHKFPTVGVLDRVRVTDEVGQNARQEIQRELTVIAAAVELTEARRHRHGRFAQLLNLNRSALPYPKATAS